MFIVGKLDELVTASEAATRLSVSLATVVNWSSRGYKVDGTLTHLVPHPDIKSERGKPMYWFRDCALAWRATSRKVRALPRVA